jgi:hypothetical protein
MDEYSNSWSEREFSGLDLGDQRLNARLMKLAEDFSKHPEFSINQASEDWGSTKAAYRFFQNKKFNETDLIKPHIKNTIQRCQKHETVLVIQDMTVAGYSHHPRTKNLGSIGGHPDPVQKSQGLNMHMALALSLQGVPLGILSNNIFSRKQNFGEGRRVDFLPTEDKESFKWIHALEESFEALSGKAKMITICDRESDFHDFYLSATALGTDVLVRSNADRDIGTRKEPMKLSEKLSQTQAYPEKVNLKAVVKEINKDPSMGGPRLREVMLEVKSTKVTLTPSRKQSQVVKEQVTLTVVEAKEINPPGDLEAVHWILLTTLDVNSYDEALMILKFYTMRWKIEEYFKILKSGCTVEKCRLADGDRLKKYLALFAIIAWRIFFMTFIRRLSPESSCETVLTKNEWQALYRWRNRKAKVPLPQDPPKIAEALRWVACLGGFLARKGDGEPGTTTIWRGWSRLQDIAAGSNLATYG